MSTAQFIIYACPNGELHNQIQGYYQQSRETCGENAAHQYMPHCSLTGFFEDEITTIPAYLQALETAYKTAKQNRIPRQIQVVNMIFKPRWHGLELNGEGVQQLMAHFAQIANSPSRLTPLRLKEWLHLSLAYEFQPQHQIILENLAQKLINPHASSTWELRFYQRHPQATWTCHQAWFLSNSTGNP